MEQQYVAYQKSVGQYVPYIPSYCSLIVIPIIMCGKLKSSLSNISNSRWRGDVEIGM